MSLPFLVHSHIPKTGGSALNRRFLLPSFAEGEVCMLYRYVFEKADRMPARHVSRAMRSFAAAGHVPYGYFDKIYPGAVYVSVFREPVERTVSFLNFVLAQPRHGVQRRLPEGVQAKAREDPDLFVNAVLDETRLAVVQSNVQTRLASGGARLGGREVRRRHLRQAIRNLARDDYLAGDQANLTAFIAELKGRFPPADNPATALRPDAKGEKRLSRFFRFEDLSARVKSRLVDANDLDLRLYERVSRRQANLTAAA